jgi:uncharacterized protein YodC (DUF2158 family)
MRPKPKTGDVMMLQSGGPSMTVMEQDGYGAGNPAPRYKDQVLCVWFDEQGHCHERLFALEALR